MILKFEKVRLWDELVEQHVRGLGLKNMCLNHPEKCDLLTKRQQAILQALKAF